MARPCKFRCKGNGDRSRQLRRRARRKQSRREPGGARSASHRTLRSSGWSEPSVVPEGVFPDRSRNGRGIEVETRSLAGGAPTLRRWVTGGRTWRAYSRSAKLRAIPAHAGHLSPARNERGHARRGASPRSVVAGRCADPGVRWPASRWKARREPEKNGCDRRVQVSWSAALRSQSLLSCRKSSIVPHSTGTGPNGMASPRFVPDDCMALPRDSYSGRRASSASWITTVANCHPALVFCNK